MTNRWNTNRRIRPERRAITLLTPVLLFIGLTVGSLGVAQASEPAPDDHIARFEINFLEDFSSHHLMAAELARLCVSRAAHSELVELCSTMEANQFREIDEMERWLQEWYDEEHQANLTEQERDQLAHMATLTGAEFERHFLMRMVPHHMIGIQEASTCLVQVYHEDLLNLCENTAMTQAEQIATMREWLRTWYGIGALDIRRSAVVDAKPSPDIDENSSGTQ